MSVRDTLVQIALSQVGTTEQGVNKVKYNDWYYGKSVSGSNYAWCHVFISWVGNEAKVLGTYIPKTASCDEGKNWYTNKGWYKKSQAYGGSYIPQIGDIIYFSGKYTQSDSTHVGIVYKVEGGTVYYVDGNAGDKVSLSSRALSSNYIIGYGSYTSESASGEYDGSDSSETSGKVVSTMNEVVKTVNYTAVSGDTLSSIAEKFGTSVSMILYLNSGITSSTNLTGVTLKLMVPISGSSGSVSSSQKITKKHTTGVTVSRPYAKVELLTETGLLSINQSLVVKENSLDNDILSISTSRDMQQDCPTFTITLSYRREWYEKISSNDLIIIHMTRPPESQSSVFFGLVDDIRKSNDYNSGTPMRSISITGRGFGKAMSRFEIGTISEINSISNSFGFMASAKLESAPSQPPAKVVELILDNYMNTGFNYTFSDGGRYVDYFQKHLKYGNNNDKLYDTTAFVSYSGNLWNLLKEFKDAPFNEMFWEVVNDKPTFIFRPTPFNESDWNNLLRIEIKDIDIISEDLGISDIETYTVFKVESESFVGETETMLLPIWYPPYYNKYGLTKLSISSKYLYGDSVDDTYRKTIDLFNWNIMNNSMENGSIIVKGSNLYKVGTRVAIESTGIEYYVEGVSHNFTFFQGWTTTLSVTRGLAPEKRFAAPWGLAQQMKQEDIEMIVGSKINSLEVGTTSSVSPTTNTPVTSGTTISVPSGLGSVHTYMGWQMITSKTSQQYKLREQAGQNFDSEGFGRINGRYVIACTTTFGKVGDYVDFYQEDGLIIKGIIGDIKNQNDFGCNKWGHNNGTCIVEFVVDKNSWYSTKKGGKASTMHANPGTAFCHPEWKKNITKVVNVGSYFG